MTTKNPGYVTVAEAAKILNRTTGPENTASDENIAALVETAAEIARYCTAGSRE